MTKTFTSAKKVLPNCWIFWDKIKTCSSGQVFYMDKPLWGLRVQAPVARSGPGSGLRRCFPVFPKVDAASPRGLMAPPGLSALGAKGSACDRLRLTGGLRAPALGRYEVPFHWGGTAPSGAISYAAFGGENHTTALRARENPPLVAGATTLPGGKHVTGFAGRRAPL